MVGAEHGLPAYRRHPGGHPLVPLPVWHGAGVALLDRGLPGRELTGQTPVFFLLNAQDTYLGYPCAWLSGRGRHHFSYALVAQEGEWRTARIPQMAWEFNCPPLVLSGAALGGGNRSCKPRPT